MRSRPRAPVPWLVGLAGLVPVFGSAAVFAFGPPQLAGPGLLSLMALAAATLSFLGGVRWGYEMSAPRPHGAVMVLACLPAAAAWALLALPITDTRIQIGGFIAAYAVQGLWDQAGVPAWYRRLRGLTTLGVLAALGLALWKAFAF